MPLSTSRDEFLHADAIEYGRKGGCFVSTGRAAAFVIAALLFAALVAALVYYFGVTTRGYSPVAEAASNGTGVAGGDVESTGGGAGGGSEGNEGPKKPAPASERLSQHVRPLLYQLHLKPYLGEGANFTFVGHVAITIIVEEGASSDTIVFHSKQLNISADEVAITVEESSTRAPAAAGGQNSSSSREQPAGMATVVAQKADPHQETYALTVSPALRPGYKYVLEIPFRGNLRESLTGFYRASYVDNGRTKWMALTQFEATDARAAFPCFDEPGLKAKFQISIAHSTNYTAVSNMPIVRSEKMPSEPGWVVDHFDTTPPMSTYLVAYIVSEMALETVNDSILVMTTPEQSHPATITNTAASTHLPLSTFISSASPRGKSLSTGVSTDTAAVDTKAINRTTATTLESAVSSGPSSRYTTVTNATSHELTSVTTGMHSSGTMSDVSTGSGATSVDSSSLSHAAYNMTTQGETSPAANSTTASSPGTSNNTVPETLAASPSTTSSPVSRTTTSDRSTSAPTIHSSGGTVLLSSNTDGPLVTANTSLALQNVSGDTTSGSPSATSNSETTFTATGGEAASSSISAVSVTTHVHGPAVTTMLSRGASPVANTTEATAVPSDRLPALPLTGGPVSNGLSDHSSRYATAVFIPSTSQGGSSQNGRTTTGSTGTSLRLTDSQVNAVFPSPAGRRKRQAPALNVTSDAEGKSTAVPLQIRMIVRPHLRMQAHYALSVTPKILNFYTEYFGIAYPLPKLDFAAIPEFQFGGMENWGLITYTETQVLIGPETTADNLEKAATTVVHELGHQWFGNLVTPTWWTDIWLNEGFATYLEYLGTNFVEPTWEMIDKFVNDMHDVMSIDSLQSTHPVSNAVGTAAQILQAFDDISYTKGACIIRMLNHSLTEPVFRKGLLIYFDKWKYSNAKQDDLWWSMEEATKEMSLHEHALPPSTSVKQVMDSWTLQPGFPVVTAIRNYVNGSVTINQTRFTTDGQLPANSSSQAWYVPVSYTTQDDVVSGNVSTKPRVWLGVEVGQRSVTIDGVLPPGAPGAAKWLLLNLQQTGYYRVNYDTANWDLLVRQLATAPLQLPTSTRAQLVSDSLSLARSGALSYSIALNLTRYLRDSRAELSVVPWEAFLDSMSHIEAGLSLTPAYVPLKRYMLSVLMPLLERLHMDPQPMDSLPIKQLRARVLIKALRLEARNVTDWAERLFERWMAAPSNYSIPVDLRPTVYCAAVMQGSEIEFNFVMAQFLNTTDPAQQRVLLSALMCSRQPSLVAMLLHAPLEGKIMRVQDALIVWSAVPRNPVARAIAFDYIREHWTNLTKRFFDTDFPIRDMLEGATAGLSTRVQLDDLKAFHKSHAGEFSYTSAAIARAIESLQEVVSWTHRFQHDIAEWLNSPAAAVQQDVYGVTSTPARQTTVVVSPTKASLVQ